MSNQTSNLNQKMSGDIIVTVQQGGETNAPECVAWGKMYILSNDIEVALQQS